MKILVTGGTGLIGRALCRKLLQRGDQLTVLSRRAEKKAATLCGENVRIVSTLAQWQRSTTFDAIVNLAGEPIVGKRWSPERKRRLRDSRIALTQEIIARMAAADGRPAVLLNASAVGYYGDTGDAAVDESFLPETPADDFGRQLCREWEEATRPAEVLGVRVCLLRTGLVLSGEGGVLKKMLPAFRCGMGARIGSGRQWMSWIHRTDEVNAILHLLGSPQSRGAYNLVAPTPVTNAGFTRALAGQLRRPAALVAPAFILKLLLGESAQLVLGGQRALPRRLLEEGFRFTYPTLPEALSELLSKPR